MKNLFSRTTEIDENRLVNVSEMPGKGVSIEGITRGHAGLTMIDHDSTPLATKRILLSEEAIEALRVILNEWYEGRGTKGLP